jgi:hypothetical protein
MSLRNARLSPKYTALQLRRLFCAVTAIRTSYRDLVTNISDHTNTQLAGENDVRCGDKHCSCGENQGVWRDRTGME